MRKCEIAEVRNLKSRSNSKSNSKSNSRSNSNCTNKGRVRCGASVAIAEVKK